MAYVHAIIYDSVIHLFIFEYGMVIVWKFMGWQGSSPANDLFFIINKLIPLKEVTTIFIAINSNVFNTQHYREKCRKCCEDNHITGYFVPEYYLLPSLSLTLVNPSLKKGEKVAVFYVNNQVSYFVFEYDGDRYQFYEEGYFELPINEKEMIKELKDIPGLKRVIINKINEDEKSEMLLAQYLRRQFKLDVIDVKSNPEYFKGSKLAQHLNSKVMIPRYPDLKDYQPFTVEINQPDKKVLFKAEDYISLPFEKSFCFVVGDEKTVVLKNGSTFKVVKKLDIAQFKGQKIKVSLSIDIDSFYVFTATVVEESPTESLAEILSIDNLVVTKPTIVFTPDNFLVLLNNHTALKDSNGKYRIPLYINFAKKKVEFGHEAVKATETDPTFVVNDILKFCLDDGDVSSNANRNFNVFKDDEGKTLLEFDTFEGRRRADLPFLIALLLKHTLKMIKAETKKTPSELDIAFKDIERTNNLLITFLKAADLMKIKLSFV